MATDRPWKKYWPEGLDEDAIVIPGDPLPFTLKRHAHADPERLAVVFYGREISRRELDDASDRFAGWLLAQSVQPGDRVALYLENSPQFVIAYMGALKAGAIVVCVNPMHKAFELQRDLVDCGARILVTADHGSSIVEEVRRGTALEAVAAVDYRAYLPAEPTLPVPASFLEPHRRATAAEDFQEIVTHTAPLARLVWRAPDDTALLQYTSGTTGVPKGAEITHRNLVANCELQKSYIELQGDEVILGVLPWFHITGMECQMNLAVYLGAPLVAIGRFEMDTVLLAIQRYRCTSTTLIATLNAAIVNCGKAAGYDLSSLRACFSGGAPVPVALAERWEKSTGFKLMEGYGLSETTAPTHINPPHRPKYGSVGLALPLTDVKLVSLEDGHTEVATGASGEVVVKGPMVMKGYWRKPKETAEVMQDGWFATGDIGRFDDEGYLHIEERKKDLIKASGYSVFPAEVEAAMFRHPAVGEVGVVGVPDPYRGEDVVAFVVLRPEARGTLDAPALVEWCRDAMAVYKAPRRVQFTDSLPKTASGKVLKRVLRERAGEQAS